MTGRRTLYIVNPAAGAGRGGARWARFQQRLREQRLRGDVVTTQRAGETGRLAREAVHNYDLLVAVGGDGTVTEVADGILASGAGARVGMGVVPTGTGNDFAHGIGIHHDEGAYRTLAEGRVRRQDVIQIQHVVDGRPAVRHALLFAAVGIISELLKRTTPRVKRLFGQRLAYGVGLIHALLDYKPPRIRVTCDGRQVEDRFLFVGASNTEIAGGGMRLAPGAQDDDGVANVNLVQAITRWDALGQIRRLYQGKHTTHPGVRYFPARSVHVESESPVEVALDGELAGFTPARFEIKPKALGCLAP